MSTTPTSTPAPIVGDPRQCLQGRIAARLFWVELAPPIPGKPVQRLRVARPHEADWPRFKLPSVELCAMYVEGWEGITDADLRGAAVGTSDPMPFDAPLCLDVLRDDFEWFGKLRDGLIDAINTRAQAKEAAAKNSSPS